MKTQSSVIAIIFEFTICANSMDTSAAPLATNTKTAVNIALNPTCTGFPNPHQSSTGWGGGSDKCSIIDGKREYASWANGLALTGGHQTANGGPPYIEPAGPRNVVIDFGELKTFNSLVVWQHGVEHTPKNAWIRYWDGQKWVGVAFIRMYSGDICYDGSASGYSCADVYTLRQPVTSDKVQYGFNNAGRNIVGTYNIHGWIYEVEVYGPGESGQSHLNTKNL